MSKSKQNTRGAKAPRPRRPAEARFVQSIPRPQLKLDPGTLAVVAYGAALRDPWDAIGIGIPWGAPLPTFKQKHYFSMPHFTIAPTATVNFRGVTMQPDRPVLWAEVFLNGSAVVFSLNGTTRKTLVAGKARLVGAAIRVTYEGRAEDRGGSFTQIVMSRDDTPGGANVATRHAATVVMEADYHPQTVFDLEFSDTGSANNDGTQGVACVVYPAAQIPADYFVEFVALTELATEAFAAPRYTTNDYSTLHHSRTPPADSVVERHFHGIVEAAHRSSVTPRSPAHAEPSPTTGPEWMRNVTKFAKDAGGVVEHGATMVGALATLGSTLGSAAEVLWPLLL